MGDAVLTETMFKICIQFVLKIINSSSVSNECPRTNLDAKKTDVQRIMSRGLMHNLSCTIRKKRTPQKRFQKPDLRGMHHEMIQETKTEIITDIYHLHTYIHTAYLHLLQKLERCSPLSVSRSCFDRQSITQCLGPRLAASTPIPR